MSRAEAWFAHLATIAVGITGLVYGWMRYFAEPADEFALANHPWQADLKNLHILFAPAIVFACGILWNNHIWIRFRTGYPERRKGGTVLLAIFFPMVASGYLIQTSSDESWLQVWIVLHVATSIVWIVVYAAHQRPGRDELQSPP